MLVCIYTYMHTHTRVWTLFCEVTLKIARREKKQNKKNHMVTFSVNLCIGNNRFFWIILYIRRYKYRKRSALLKSTWKGNDANDNSLCNSTLTWDTLYSESCRHPVIYCQGRVLAGREHWDAEHWRTSYTQMGQVLVNV